MTRPSKQARTFARWREQAARLIALAEPTSYEGVIRDGLMRGRAKNLLAGLATFDVTLVRAYAERMLAEGERAEAERVVFADWTRTLGKGPENRERGAFGEGPVTCGDCGGYGMVNGYSNDVQDCPAKCYRGTVLAPVCGGWPGPLAREWGTVECGACEGKGRMLELIDPVHGRAIQRSDGYIAATRWSKCKPRRGRGRLPHPSPKRHRSAPNGGAWMIRAARRLLDTLDGRCPWAPSAEAQASVCQACCGPRSLPRGLVVATADGGTFTVQPGHRVAFVVADGMQVVGRDGQPRRAILGEAVVTDCPDCRGTGHNLAGVLPEVEPDARTFRSVADALVALREAGEQQGWGRHALADWQAEIHDSAAMTVADDPGTRVVPRGEHRRIADYYVRPRDIVEMDASDRPPLDARINARCWDARPAQRGGDLSRWPRWRRGELRHAEQRRRRDSRALVDERLREAHQAIEDAAGIVPDTSGRVSAGYSRRG